MTASPSESELLAACRGGASSLSRERAWDMFVQRYARLVRAVVRRTADRLGLATTPEDCEDMVADVFVELLRADAAVLARYEGRASFAAYLAVVARRLVIRRVRARHRLVAPQPIEPATEGDTRQVDDREEVARLLSSLEPDEARLVKLYHLEARSYGEISRITGMPINSVGPALSRARAKLRGPTAVRLHDPERSTSAESDPVIQRAGGVNPTDGSARSTGS
jgi:RNA polymerase sigma factor, sigma-70 family